MSEHDKITNGESSEGEAAAANEISDGDLDTVVGGAAVAPKPASNPAPKPAAVLPTYPKPVDPKLNPVPSKPGVYSPGGEHPNHPGNPPKH